MFHRYSITRKGELKKATHVVIDTSYFVDLRLRSMEAIGSNRKFLYFDFSNMLVSWFYSLYYLQNRCK